MTVSGTIAAKMPLCAIMGPRLLSDLFAMIHVSHAPITTKFRIPAE